MKIILTPQRRDDTLMLEKIDDNTIAINGEEINLSEEIEHDWIIGKPTLIDDEWHVTVILPHGFNPSHEVAFPEPITVSENGKIAVPFDEVEA